MGAVAYAVSLLAELPGLISAGKEVVGLIQHGSAALKTMQSENRGPTDKENADLDALIKSLRDELHAD